jgi:hypothetical protein
MHKRYLYEKRRKEREREIFGDKRLILLWMGSEMSVNIIQYRILLVNFLSTDVESWQKLLGAIE